MVQQQEEGDWGLGEEAHVESCQVLLTGSMERVHFNPGGCSRTPAPLELEGDLEGEKNGDPVFVSLPPSAWGFPRICDLFVN